MLGPLLLLCLVASSWAAQVCCPNIGCFTDDPPFDSLPLPWCAEQINPSYTMYTRSNPNVGQAFDHTSVPADFNPALRTAFIVHGYQNNGGTGWLHDMKDAFLDRENINVAIVGWGGGADIPNYLQAASNTRSTGAYTALVVDNLVNSGGGAIAYLWMIGHSLGAHLAGLSSKGYTRLARITGLDPAGPWFESSADVSIGLNPSSANFVDVIHTDSQTYGTLRPLGHIDFYAAGGHDQPGCGSDVVGCSHGRAVSYMLESIRQDCFLSRSSCSNYNNIPGSCTSCKCGAKPCAIMGYAADSGCQTTGVYYLDIVDSAPFCQLIEEFNNKAKDFFGAKIIN